MPVITFANQKGGVGKTTSAVTVAHSLALKGKEVLIVDLDPQGQCATLLGISQESGVFSILVQEYPLKTVTRYSNREGLWIVPGNSQTSTAQTVMGVLKTPISKLRDILRPAIKGGLDYVIIDTAPSVGDLQAQGLWAADYIMIPSACDFASAQGVIMLMRTVENLREDYGWKGELLGVLPTFYDETTKETKATLEDLKKHFPDGILPPIHRATVLRECMARGQTIFEVDQNSRSAEEYEEITKHIIRITK